MKNLNYYLSLDYPIIINRIIDEGDTFFSAKIEELPGLVVFSNTIEDAIKDLELAKKDWLEVSLELGRPIVEPMEDNSTDETTGRITLRLPKSLHRILKKNAILESLSLNQYIIYLITNGIRNLDINKILDSINNLGKSLGKSFNNETENYEKFVYSVVSDGEKKVTKGQYETNDIEKFHDKISTLHLISNAGGDHA